MGLYDQVVNIGSQTGYQIEGTSGATVSVGTPELKFEISVSYLRMPLKHTGSGASIMFQGAGGGVGAGVSLSIPFVNASGGPDAMPSVGSRLLRGPAWSGNGGFRAFAGEVYFLTGSAMGIGHSAEHSLVLFVEPLPRLAQIVSAASPVSIDAATLLPRTKAVGLCWGLNLASTLGGVGISGMKYTIFPT